MGNRKIRRQKKCVHGPSISAVMLEKFSLLTNTTISSGGFFNSLASSLMTFAGKTKFSFAAYQRQREHQWSAPAYTHIFTELCSPEYCSLVHQIDKESLQICLCFCLCHHLSTFGASLSLSCRSENYASLEPRWQKCAKPRKISNKVHIIDGSHIRTVLLLLKLLRLECIWSKALSNLPKRHPSFCTWTVIQT